MRFDVEEKYRMIADVPLFVMFVAMLVVHLFMMGFFLFAFLTDNVPLRGSREEELLMVSLLEFALFVSGALLISGMRKKCNIVTVGKNGIALYPLFCMRKPQEIPFDYYTYIHYAYYLHGSPIKAYKVQYLVLTNKKLTQHELSHINQVTPSVDLIRIRYSKRQFPRLAGCMPTHLANKITRIRDIYIT